jgi:hypothetical protein
VVVVVVVSSGSSSGVVVVVVVVVVVATAVQLVCPEIEAFFLAMLDQMISISSYIKYIEHTENVTVIRKPCNILCLILTFWH